MMPAGRSWNQVHLQHLADPISRNFKATKPVPCHFGGIDIWIDLHSYPRHFEGSRYGPAPEYKIDPLIKDLKLL